MLKTVKTKPICYFTHVFTVFLVFKLQQFKREVSKHVLFGKIREQKYFYFELLLGRKFGSN